LVPNQVLPVYQLMAEQVEPWIREDDEGLQDDEEEHQEDVDPFRHKIAG
jgi:hypothetical protein